MISPNMAVDGEPISTRLHNLPFTAPHLCVMIAVGTGLLFDQMEISISTVLTAVFLHPAAASAGTHSWCRRSMVRRGFSLDH